MRGNWRETISFLFLSWVCVKLTLQQSVQSMDSATDKNQGFKIQFKQDSLQPPVINFKQTQYSYSPQIDDEYSIVHTVIYPQGQGSGKFVSSLPKDSFVKKLNEKNQHQDDTINTKQQSQAQINHEKLNDQQQIENKASDILKKQTFEQQAKIQQEKQIKVKKSSTQSQSTPLPPDSPKNPSKIDQTLQNQQTKNTENISPEQPIPKQLQKEEQHVSKAEEKPQQQDQKLKQDLFASIQPKDIPQIQKTDQTIKFKEHQISKPLTITNYPFEVSSERKEVQQKSKQNEKNIEDKKLQVLISKKEAQNLQKQTKKQPEIQKKIQSQTAMKSEPKKIEPKAQIIVSETEGQIAGGINTENQGQKPPNTLIGEKQYKVELDSSIVDQFNRIKKLLSIDPSQVKKELRFQNIVRQQLEESDWKLLIVKIIMWTSILIAIYQATCSSQSRQKGVDKGKYSPVSFSELQSENSLQMTETTDQK